MKAKVDAEIKANPAFGKYLADEEIYPKKPKKPKKDKKKDKPVPEEPLDNTIKPQDEADGLEVEPTDPGILDES